MANAEIGEYDLKVGDDTFTLRLGSNALAEIEDTLGLDLTDIIEQFQSGRVKISLLRGLMFGALREHHAEKSLSDAGNLIDKIGAVEATNVLAETFKRALPKAEGGNPRNRAGAGTGTARSKPGSRSPATPRRRSGR